MSRLYTFTSTSSSDRLSCLATPRYMNVGYFLVAAKAVFSKPWGKYWELRQDLEERENDLFYSMIQDARKQREEGFMPKEFDTIEELLEYLNRD